MYDTAHLLLATIIARSLHPRLMSRFAGRTVQRPLIAVLQSPHRAPLPLPRGGLVGDSGGGMGGRRGGPIDGVEGLIGVPTHRGRV